MVKVSGAFSGQIMIMYHHCAATDPLRAVPRSHGLRDSINLAYRGVKNYLGALSNLIKEPLDMASVLNTLYITYGMQNNGPIETCHTHTKTHSGYRARTRDRHEVSGGVLATL